MKLSLKNLLGVAAVGFLSAASAFAIPSFTTFGPLPGANFGGSGNPTDPVAITTFGSLTLALAAQQRYDNPALGNDGNGTYSATAGTSAEGPNNVVGALWNFDYYINNTTTAGSDPYTYRLEYGLLGGTVFTLNPLGIGDNSPVSGFGGQNSQNLSFFAYGTLAAFQLNTFSFDPTTPFNPDANAVYQFNLIATDGQQNDVANVSILVDVTGGTSSVPDSGSTLLFAGAALAGMVGLRRRLSV